MKSKLALLGGTPVMSEPAPKSLFKWPIITGEDEAAALDVLRRNAFSGTDITMKFQEEFAAWQGTKYALAFCNGTMSLAAAMFAIGLGAGDEIICPTKTYWASITQAAMMGATAVFCNINETLCMDPDDIERCITPNTKAIMVVHYSAHPCDMDKIMPIARKHNLMVIEDVSHAQGGLYKGKKLGTFGDVAAMSLMSGKSFAAGELGILVTDNRRIYERAIAYGHYERNNENNILESDELKPYFKISLGGVKGRANQMCTALARVQLKYYDERCAEIRKALNYFWDQLEGVAGIRPIRVDESTGSNMAGWYSPHGLYIAEELGGLSAELFCKAIRAELPDFQCWAGGNYCLHTHEFFRTFDFMHVGKPSRIAFNNRDAREDDALCDRSLNYICVSVPWFKHYEPEWIDQYVAAFKKVSENYKDLLDFEEMRNGDASGRWYGTDNTET